MNQACEHAKALFAEGYNCAQAVFLSFPEVTGMDDESAARLTNCLGGGVAGTGSLCGAVSAGCLVLSAGHGRYTPSRVGEQLQRQQATYRLVQEYQERFRQHYGDVNCPALLEYGLAMSGDASNEKHLCPVYVGQGARWVAELLAGEEESEQQP